MCICICDFFTIIFVQVKIKHNSSDKNNIKYCTYLRSGEAVIRLSKQSYPIVCLSQSLMITCGMHRCNFINIAHKIIKRAAICCICMFCFSEYRLTMKLLTCKTIRYIIIWQTKMQLYDWSISIM